MTRYATQDTDIDPYRRFGLPETGFRNYWYPVLMSGEVGRKPVAVTLLDEGLVLFRDGGKLHALEDRCPHRGVKLSAGHCLYPGSGTITCPYHGWTFDGRSGQLVAALVEGPDAGVVGKTAVKSYPVAEHGGMVWVFVGDMEPVALTEDMAEFIADLDTWMPIPMWTDYKCNWRALVDNWCADHHAMFVHRNSPELVFLPILPFAQTITHEVAPDGKGLIFRTAGGMTEAHYPGVGRFPRVKWHRFLNPAGRGKPFDPKTAPAVVKYGITFRAQTRLPGCVFIGRTSGDYFLLQFAVPLDAGRTRLFNINLFRRKGPLKALYDRVHYWLWRGWAHDRIFSDQDKVAIEQLVPGAERLSKTDVGMIAWRKWAGENARRAPGATPLRPRETAAAGD